MKMATVGSKNVPECLPQTGVRGGARHCDTNRKAAGFCFADGVFDISGRTVALGSTQPLTKMSTRVTPKVVKAAGA